MMRVEVKPEMLRWARERAGLDISDLIRRTPLRGLPRWERAEARPTLKQVEGFAKATHTPIGYLFLPEPPDEPLPLPDMRVGAGLPAGRRLARPSPNLLDTIYICQQRQAWYREFAITVGEAPRAFVGSVRRTRSVEAVAAEMRGALGFDLEERSACPTWTEALRRFIAQADAIGVLVMASGVVLNNTHRKLDPAEFRGFALADDLAPLVFINAADTCCRAGWLMGFRSRRAMAIRSRDRLAPAG
jgi:transcriptional regulator with XRE-family HTH domain